MTHIIWRPLTVWDGELRDPDDRQVAHFGKTWSDTLNMLDREAHHLGALEVVVHIALPERRFRVDGQPYADAKPKHPGVTVVLPTSDHGRISWSCDLYSSSTWSTWQDGTGRVNRRSEGWQANIRAIVETMNGLRAADRHGVASGRQFAGFRELPAGEGAEPARPPAMTVEEAAEYIIRASGDDQLDIAATRDLVIRRSDIRQVLYRAAARVLHPDAGGDGIMFHQLEQAKTLLDKQDGGGS